MSFRTVVITRQCKCSYKNGFLVVRDEKTSMIHLSEIYCLVLDTTAVSISAYLINELITKKIPLVFCDETHNPSCEILPFYGCHNSSKKIKEQIEWTNESKETVWTIIVSEKIKQQALHLEHINNPNYIKLFDYLSDIEFNDITNREGHAAKVYFNSLFGSTFNREESNDINAALDYGYSILLSAFNKEVIANGFLTQLGICHKNEYNQFNLSCDLMEPFRPLVDRYVFEKMPFIFDKDIRFDLINLLNKTVRYEECQNFITSVIGFYVKNVLKTLSNCQYENIKFFELV